MGNSVGIGVYHPHNSFKFTERVWREANSRGNANGKHVFRLRISVGKFGLPFKKSAFFGNFPFGKTKLGFPFTVQSNFSDFFGKR